jgi:hypothetical protein
MAVKGLALPEEAEGAVERTRELEEGEGSMKTGSTAAAAAADTEV